MCSRKGYLGRKRHFTEVRRLTASPTATSYWKPGTFDQWQWNSKAGSTVLSVKMQDGHSMVHPRLSDDRNLKASSLSNTFSATTKLREVPVHGVYKKEIQEFRCRSPSARGVRSVPMTNRSLIGAPSVKSSVISARTLEERQMKGSHQITRLVREQERMERTREMKRQAQIAEHRMDRMYYMNGAPVKLHAKYDVSDDDIERLQAIAITRGIKLSPTSSMSYHTRTGPKSTSVPNSSPRDIHRGSDAESGTRTIIPTADVVSVGGDLVSEDGTVASEKVTTSSLGSDKAASSGREDAATSDHEDAELKVESEVGDLEDDTGSRVAEDQGSEVKGEDVEKLDLPDKSDEELSIKSDSALLSPEATNAPLAVSGAFLTDLTGGDD